MPIHVPMVDVHTIGAGGGSIASVDAAGHAAGRPGERGRDAGADLLRPRRHAADDHRRQPRPRPARSRSGCSRSSTRCRWTRSAPRCVEHVGAPLGLDATQAAAAIVRVANDRMAGAIRMVSLARGHDPRDFALFAFGGAGPLHAAALARELAIPKLLIPARPGLTNALGCVVADLRHDFVATVNQPLEALAEGAHRRRCSRRRSRSGRALLARENVAVERVVTLHRADMQFQGQSHILPVAIESAAITRRRSCASAFAAAYWQRFGVELPEIRPVLVNLHTAVIGKRKPVSLRAIAAATPEGDARRGEAHDAAGLVRRRLARRRRSTCASGCRSTRGSTGPAIVEQLDCTTVIEPGNRVEVDAIGNLIVSV